MAKNSQKVLVITPDSPFSDIVAYSDARFKNLSKEIVENSKKNFKSFDLDGDGFLDLHDVTKMMEKLGETKTATEVRQMIAEIDHDKDGKISFVEFLEMLSGPSKDGKAPTTEQLPIFGKIYNTNLKNHAKFFEEKMAAQKDKTMDNKEQIKKEYEEKKRVQEIRKQEQEKERKAAEEEEAKKQESRQRLAARAAMFDAK